MTTRRIMHKKRGSTYTVLGEGKFQVSEANIPYSDPANPARVITDGDTVVTYRDEATGALYHRFPDEMEDGRFEELDPLPTAAPYQLSNVISHPIAEKFYQLGGLIEALGASPELTHVITGLHELRRAVEAELNTLLATKTPAKSPTYDIGAIIKNLENNHYQFETVGEGAVIIRNRMGEVLTGEVAQQIYAINSAKARAYARGVEDTIKQRPQSVAAKSPSAAEQAVAALLEHGGCLVGSGSASLMEITDAQARGDFYTTPEDYGIIRRTKEWLDRVHKADNYMQPKEDGAGSTIIQDADHIKATTPITEGHIVSDPRAAAIEKVKRRLQSRWAMSDTWAVEFADTLIDVTVKELQLVAPPTPPAPDAPRYVSREELADAFAEVGKGLMRVRTMADYATVGLAFDAMARKLSGS